MPYKIFGFFILLLLISCSSDSDEADLVITNAVIYTAEDSGVNYEAIAIKKGRILKVGSNEEILKTKDKNTKSIDALGQFLMPGFIEGHGHLIALGQSLIELNFTKSKSWDDVVNQVSNKAKNAKPGEWIIGNGWHQEKWNKTPDQSYLGYPYHDLLSAATPDNPVMLMHASGHALFANKKAMDLAGLSADTPNPSGGLIVKDNANHILGVFEENAMQTIQQTYGDFLDQLDEDTQEAYWEKAFELAQDECLKNGITSFQDAGTSYDDIEKYKSLILFKKLKIRLWVMLRHSYDEMKNNMANLPLINAGNHLFTCRAIKTEVDGALGSYGAWLKEPYHDKPGFIGQNTTTLKEVDNIAQLAATHDMQLCVHAIGDRANHEVLNIFDHRMPKDRRWRIEHAQHLDPIDIPRFGKSGAIASMQAVHCTSDAPFVEKRLGLDRSRDGAYAWRSLIDSGGHLANGTDAPVEDVSALESIYASVSRKRTDSDLTFFPAQKMTRDEALKSYTIWNAYAAFEEDDKGSIEVGKLADLVLLSKNLLTCADEEILDTKVLMTIVGGKVYDY